jgi:hypothetical protein
LKYWIDSKDLRCPLLDAYCRGLDGKSNNHFLFFTGKILIWFFTPTVFLVASLIFPVALKSFMSKGL